MSGTQNPRQQNSSGVPIWLIVAIVLLILFSCGIMALLYQRSSSGSDSANELPTQAAIAEAPSATPSATYDPQGPTSTPSWTPRPSNTPYLTPTFVNTAIPGEVNTRSAGDISGYTTRQITGGGGNSVIVPTVTQAIPRSTQTAVAATATQAIEETQVAGTATQISATATQIAATSTSAAASATPIPGIWRGDYYNNRDLQDPIVMVRDEPVQTLNNLYLLHNWGANSPNSGVVNSDNFSARWRLNANFNATNYLFYAFSDDGVRVYVDDGTVIDQWTNASNRVLYGNRSLSSGQHSIRVEYFEDQGDARIAVGWQQVVENAWVGEYYDNNNLGQPPVYIQQDNSINEDWGSGSPSALPSDNFSIRWSRNYNFSNAALYRFTITVDDGVRLYVDGQRLINEWHSVNSPQTYIVEETLSGTKNVTLEYFEGSGNAEIALDISRVDSPTATPIPPTSTTAPTSTLPPTITLTPTETSTPSVTPSHTPTSTPTNTPVP